VRDLPTAVSGLLMARLLVVDDDPSLLRVLRIGLVARGYDVVTARDGASGLTQAAMTSPDVIVLDIGLGDLDGLEVCRRIRQWSEVPVVVLSAFGAEDRKVAALDGGADDYMTKPFGMAELEARIRVALRHVQERALSAESMTPARPAPRGA
jgi:two-component system KDP operon response regulator KdpE